MSAHVDTVFTDSIRGRSPSPSVVPPDGFVVLVSPTDHARIPAVRRFIEADLGQ